MIAKKFSTSLFSLLIGVGFASCTLSPNGNNPIGPMDASKITCGNEQVNSNAQIKLADAKTATITIRGINLHDDVRILFSGIEVPHSQIAQSFQFTDTGEKIVVALPASLPIVASAIDVTFINPKSDNSVPLPATVPTDPAADDTVVVKGCFQLVP